MDDNNYAKRRTELLFRVGLHQCLQCGHVGSPKNGLEFHHPNMNGHAHGCGGRQVIVRLEQDFWEYEHGDKSRALMVLCHDCHIKEHIRLDWEKNHPGQLCDGD